MQGVSESCVCDKGLPHEVLDIEFAGEFVGTILSMVRVCTPQELCSTQVCVSWWHLHSTLEPPAYDSSFCVDEAEMKNDVMKAAAGMKVLNLLCKVTQI